MAIIKMHKKQAHKYDYEPDLKLFTLKERLAGMKFPFNYNH